MKTSSYAQTCRHLRSGWYRHLLRRAQVNAGIVLARDRIALARAAVARAVVHWVAVAHVCSVRAAREPRRVVGPLRAINALSKQRDLSKSCRNGLQKLGAPADLSYRSKDSRVSPSDLCSRGRS